MKPIYLIWLAFFALAGCGNDTQMDNKHPIQHPSHSIAAAQYQAVTETSGGSPVLWHAQLVDEQLITLQRLDDREQQTLWRADFDSSTGIIQFDAEHQCQQAETLICTFEGQTVTFTPFDAAPPQLSSLNGQYQLLIDNDIAQIEISQQGVLTGQWLNCHFSGQLQEKSAMVIDIDQSDCDAITTKGVLTTTGLYEPNDTLLVTLPNSPLAGTWFKIDAT